MHLRQIYAVNNNQCTKVHVCQDDGPYESGLKVTLAEGTEFVMAESPIIYDTLEFFISSDEEDRTIEFITNSRILSVAANIDTIPESVTYSISLYTKYEGHDILFPVLEDAISLTESSESFLYRPQTGLIVPMGSKLIAVCEGSGGSPPYDRPIVLLVHSTPFVN